MRVVENFVTCALVLFIAVFAAAPPTEAQPLVDPRRTEFTPSADHNATDTSGTALVDNYTLQVFIAGTSTVVQTVNLGKPNPDPDGLIRVDFVALLPSPLQTNVIYEARVSANGRGGSATSTPSNTFSFSPPCTIPTLNPTSQSVAASGGSGTIAVTVGTGCAWTVTSNAAWLTITTGSSGIGSGSVTFSASANTATTPRTGALTIGGVTFTVTQTAAPCTFSPTPATISAPPAGGTGTINVSAQSGCAWSAASGAAWVTVTGSGSGAGSASYTVEANTTGATRTASITIGDVPVTITQPPLTPPLAPTNVRIIK